MTRAAKIVWFIGLAIFIGWLTHRAFGQTFQRSLPFLAKPISLTVTNEDPSGSGYLYYKWVASDLPTGPVTNWVDRIHGAVMTNGNIAGRPTNGPSGIYFNGSSSSLTNTVLSTTLSPGGSNSVFFILNPDTVGSGYYDVMGNLGNAHGWILHSATLQWYLGGLIAQPMATGLQDWTLIFGNEVVDRNTYTNGILSKTNSNIPSFETLNSLGWALNGYYQGKILEVHWYVFPLSSLQVSNLHYYATNTYGFSP